MDIVTSKLEIDVLFSTIEKQERVIIYKKKDIESNLCSNKQLTTRKTLKHQKYRYLPGSECPDQNVRIRTSERRKTFLLYTLHARGVQDSKNTKCAYV